MWGTYTPATATVLTVPTPWEAVSPASPVEESTRVDTPSPDTPTPESTVKHEPTPNWSPPVETPSSWCCFMATRYGTQYEGQPLGCKPIYLPAGRPDALYHSSDPAILAVGPGRYGEWECGRYLRVHNPATGRSLDVVRMDSCPGCHEFHLDLSEAGMAWLCGVEYPQTCDRLTGLLVGDR